jgi:hypothetical protein
VQLSAFCDRAGKVRENISEQIISKNSWLCLVLKDFSNDRREGFVCCDRDGETSQPSYMETLADPKCCDFFPYGYT